MRLECRWERSLLDSGLLPKSGYVPKSGWGFACDICRLFKCVPASLVVSLSHEGNVADHLKVTESSAWKHRYFYKYVAVKGNLHVRYASHGPYSGEFIRGRALRSEARAA